ncbi:MAG TPA: PspA/IM30 family protein [Cytophagaceae bacterium]|jgi:phage shock protein A|nr:PspA/IM30 family protein [Cytophagaceae bacterium]
MWKRFFQRLNNIFKAKAHDALDQVEDPVQMMKLAVAEMEQSIFKSTEALAKAMGNQKNLVKQAEQYKLETESWLSKATTAIKTGQDELGKKALEKKALAEKQYEQYKALSENAGVTVEQLKTQLDRMKAKLEEAKAKESILSAKMSSAKAQKEIAEQLGGMNYTPLAEFQKYEKKILQVESESEAMTELISHEGKLEKEFEELETESSVFSDYEVIKNQLKQEEEQKKRLEEERKHQKINQILNNEVEKKDIKSLPEEKKKLLDGFMKNDDQNNDNKQKKIDDFFKNE